MSPIGSDDVFVANSACGDGDLVDGREDLALELELLGHGLDHDVGAA